ncbi:hypothetical protein [Streptomyces sp. NPDC029004]|uniref:hypothetical protein n=1 Tax=Streptomyces sp. NPDC029004 TaxID=3154490 RepID=UPI0033E567A2
MKIQFSALCRRAGALLTTLRWRWWFPVLAVAAFLVMEEISQLLGALSSKDHFSYDAHALTGWPGLWPAGNTDRADAVQAWAAIHDELLHDRADAWLTAYVGLDMYFALAYVFGLYWILRRIWHFREDQRSPRRYAIPFSLTWIKVLAAALLAADWAETVATFILVHGLPTKPSGFWAGAVTWLSWAKWLLLGSVVLLGVVLLAVDILPVSLTRWSMRWRRGESRSARVWSRHRTQLGVLVLLAALIALPGGGPLEQIPDIERSWAGQGVTDLLTDVAGPVLALTVLSLALWIAGRWALLDGTPAVRRDPHPPWLFLVLAVAVAVLVSFLMWSADPWGDKAGAYAIPLVILAIAIIGIWVGGPAPDPDESPEARPPAGRQRGRIIGLVLAAIGLVLAVIGRVLAVILRGTAPLEESSEVRPPADRERVRTIGRVLAVIPFMIAGLGLVRAFARPVLLGSSIRSVSYGESVFWFLFGLAVALVVPVLVYGGFHCAEEKLFGDPSAQSAEAPDEAQKRRRKRVPLVLGWLLIGVTAALGVWTAVDPLGLGSGLRTLGLLSLLFATVALLGAWFTRCAEARHPSPAFRLLRFRYTPIWLVAFAVVLVQGMLDQSGTYHAVRLLKPEPNANQVRAFDAQSYFNDWSKHASDCLDADGVPKSAAIPMLFVAAAGGGIRAAYWTGSGMDRITQSSPCAPSFVFGTSGVSGGSLGLAAHTISQQETAPGEDSGQEVVAALADEEALSADVAAAIYRDGLHAFHGMNRMLGKTIGDRASVFEQSWESHSPLERDFLTATGRKSGSETWRPMLLLNGTDVSSGCRVAISPQWTTGKPGENETLTCQKPEVSAAQANGAGTQFETASIDAAAYNDSAHCRHSQDQSLRLSTAVHLSARFVYVSPSGTMYRCTNAHKDDKNDDRKADKKYKKDDTDFISSIDGGYLENSGMAALLELWSALEPAVAAYNKQASADNQSAGGENTKRYVVPLIALLDNHYSTRAPDPEIEPENELTAPLVGRRAPKSAVRSATLEQAALVRFSGPVPGLDAKATVHADSKPDLAVRSFRVAPSKNPNIAAPLGWVLSTMSMESLDDQMGVLATNEQERSSHPLEAEDLLTLLEVIKGPVRVVLPHDDAPR